MESLQPNPEAGEKEKYQPKYMLFIGRHAEPARKSIFDQVGGEAGITSNNFEESSLTLKGVVDSSLLNYDLLGEITKRMPTGKIKIILGNTGAYRTRETAQIIKEKLEGEAKRLDRDVMVEIEGTGQDELLTETKEEKKEKLVADIRKIVTSVREKSLESGHGLVYFGITHDAKLSNFLEDTGIATDGVDTSEFLTITDEGEGKNQVSFRGQTIELEIEPEQAQ
jgi:hypothetical protein